MTHPLALIILDGWGHAEASPDNAIHLANTPVWDRLWRESPHALLQCAGAAVGLPDGQMGNSEVGHLCLGAGRIVPQSLARIDQAIADGSFFTNAVMRKALGALAPGACLHIIGLVSPGGVHSHERHVHAALRAAARCGVARVAVHAFLDGRDTPPRSALASLQALETACQRDDAPADARIASITGRYYAMDRDQRWERTERAFALLVQGHGQRSAASAELGLQAAYAGGEGDEHVAPTQIGAATPIRDGDAVWFMNFRADRARQLTRAFLTPAAAGFPARPARLSAFISLTAYAEDLPSGAMFPTQPVHGGLGEHIAAQGLTQLRLAETEKYAHVTFFFSGGRERPFPGESRILLPSPPVADYRQTPAMSAEAITDALVDALTQRRHDMIICNYANGDMIGHTGDLAAAIQAVEVVDHSLGRIAAALGDCGASALITADHGNCERMHNAALAQPHTAHTLNAVPLVYLGPRAQRMRAQGNLADVAPSALRLMGLSTPPEMTGRSLI